MNDLWWNICEALRRQGVKQTRTEAGLSGALTNPLLGGFYTAGTVVLILWLVGVL